jgi:hypothetical protein
VTRRIRAPILYSHAEMFGAYWVLSQLALCSPHLGGTAKSGIQKTLDCRGDLRNLCGCPR